MVTGAKTATQDERLRTLERRVEELTEHVKTLVQRAGEFDNLRAEVGKLKFEVEDMREG